jgi:PKD repeat protein
MGKKIVLFFIVLLLFVSSVFAITTFVYNESDLVSLQPEATDPDAQQLIYSFTEPLDENGEWQTTYGDSGEYTVTITVSDGELSTSQEVLITINRKEEKPSIDIFTPSEDPIAINEGTIITFEISASDLNKDTLSYNWFIDDVSVSNDDSIEYETDYQDAGNHNVRVVVSDKISEVSKEWVVEVEDISLENVLGSIQNLEIEETELASLQLPNFKKYGLTYSISDPLGTNKWQTSYDDAGEYEVTVEAEGKGFSSSKNVKVTVKNKDRAPVFIDLKDIAIKENEGIIIELNAQDPDEEEVIYSAQDMPDGASLDGNTFKWKTDFDFVKKESGFDYVLDKFRLLSRSVNVIFIAESNENIIEKQVKITVRDANRPFALEPFETITVDEGEEVVIQPSYNDPDNDALSFTYSGWMNKNIYKTNFNDAGTYIVKVTASDDFFTASEFVTVTVENVNREPIFEPIRSLGVTENETLEILLQAEDPDNDIISFSAENLPENAKLEENIFTFNPGFDFVKDEEKSVEIEFFAEDDESEVGQSVDITVLNKNLAPKIVDSSRNVKVKVGESVRLFVTAEDPDEDEISYLWDFGLFDKHNATSVHKRTFSSKGIKEVEVTVSDGIKDVSQILEIEVV